MGSAMQNELEQTHLQLWILLVVNCFSSILQLMLDVYIAWVVVGRFAEKLIPVIGALIFFSRIKKLRFNVLR